MSFTIGEYVVGLDSYEGNDIRGLKGKIICIREDSPDVYCVEFEDKPPYGHNGDGHGKDGYCWWVTAGYIRRAIASNEEAVALLHKDELSLP